MSGTGGSGQARGGWSGRAGRVVAVAALGAAAVAGLGGCAPLLVGGAVVGTTLVAIDRRTSGIQLEDQNIELKGAPRARTAAGGDAAHVNVTSYNRLVLLTGEVPTDAARRAAEQAVAQVENVRSIVNELAVAGTSTLTSRSNDSILTGRVKAAFLDGAVPAAAVKVVTERGVVHLMGRLTEREGERATQVARRVPGVQKVVRVFEPITEQELAAIQGRAGTPGR
ncbi:MAG: BON domain-containing protein [Rubrivivax sp.]